MAVRDRLRALLPSAGPPPDGGDEPPGRRGLAMLLSVVVAAVMWFSFSMRESYSVTMRLPIVIEQTPAGQALREPPPEAATVTFSGDGWTLLSLTRRRPAIRVVAEDATVDLRAALQEQQSGLPAGVEVGAVQPATITLALDRQTTRRLPIRLRQDIETDLGYDLLRPPRLSPDSVTVTGAQSLLGVLDDWPTEVLRAEGVEGDLMRTVALADTFGGLLTPAVRTTDVSLDIGEFTEDERELQVEVENLPPDVAGIRFDPPRVRAVYQVPVEGEVADRAERSPRFRAVVDYFDIQRDTTDGEVPVSPRWPDDLDVRDVRLEPSRVGYFIQRPAQAPPDGE